MVIILLHRLGLLGGAIVLFRFQRLPFPVLRVIAGEVLNHSTALEDQQVVDHLVHEITVVADHDDASREILQIFLKHLKRLDVKVIGRLVEDEKVGILHQQR